MTGQYELCGRVYGLLLHLYPVAFQTEFGEEMRSVFLARLVDSERAGRLHIAAVCLRELSELSVHAFLEHLRDWGKEENTLMKKKQPTTTILIVLPLILAVFLAVINPRFVLRLFSDVLGWLIILGLMLSVCLSLLVHRNPAPETNRRKLGIALLSLLAVVALLLGPVLIMVSDFATITYTGSGIEMELLEKSAAVVVMQEDGSVLSITTPGPAGRLDWRLAWTIGILAVDLCLAAAVGSLFVKTRNFPYAESRVSDAKAGDAMGGEKP